MSILESQIIEIEERLRQAMLHNDIPVLDELIAPDLLFTGLDGQLASKEDDLAFHRAEILSVKVFEPSQQHIQIHPDFAVVSVLIHLIGTFDGAPVEQNLRYTRVWSIAPDGSLQITAGHMSEIQPA